MEDFNKKRCIFWNFHEQRRNLAVTTGHLLKVSSHKTTIVGYVNVPTIVSKNTNMFFEGGVLFSA